MVSCLQDLLLYLLQLVQALKYENFALVCGESASLQLQDSVESIAEPTLRVSKILETQISSSVDDCSSIFLSDSTFPMSLTTASQVLVQGEASHNKRKVGEIEPQTNTNGLDLASFLIYRACENTTLVNYFYWLVFTELKFKYQ